MPRESFNLIDHVVNTVDAQTCGPQPDRIPAEKIVLILTDHGNKNPRDVLGALDTAIEEGRLGSDGENVWIPGP